MALHRLTHIVMGVPNVDQTAAYYGFGLSPISEGPRAGRGSATTDGGGQLRIVHRERRRLVQLRIGADDTDELDRSASSLDRLSIAFAHDEISLTDSTDPVASNDDAVDWDNIHLPHLAEFGHIAALVQRDHNVFGTAAEPAHIASMVDDLRRQLETGSNHVEPPTEGLE